MSLHTTVIDAAKRRLQHRLLPLHLALLAIVLCSPSLWLGLQNDDHYHRFVLTDPPLDPEWTRHPARLFEFLDGDRDFNRRMIAAGALPWWADEELRITFMRPLAGLSHGLDYQLWPERPWLMHLQSLLWFGAAIAATAVLYRRVLGATWLAGFAGLLFTLDDAHALPAVWIANRNSVIAVALGVTALIGHIAWRREGSRIGAVVAPAALAAALLASESALAVGAYLAAYALFIDSGRAGSRLLSLLPCAMVGLIWWLAYTGLGYGAQGSAMYIDPASGPVRFLGAVVDRAPLLLMGQWSIPSDLGYLASEQAGRLLWFFALAIVVIVVALTAPLLRRDRVSQFFAAGMVLSILPACATFPSDRLLIFAGIGGAGLLAQLLAGIWSRADWLPRARWYRAGAHAAAAVLAFLHLVLAPFVLLLSTANVAEFGGVIRRAAESLPSEPQVRDEIVVIVNTPTFFVSSYGPIIQMLAGRPVPRRTYVLASGIRRIMVARPDERTLTVEPEGGFFAGPGGRQLPGTHRPAAFDTHYVYPMFDRLYRDSPMHAEDTIDLDGIEARVRSVTDDGRPLAVEFRFSEALEERSLHWLQWIDGRYAPFVPPPVGSALTLAPVSVPPTRAR